MSSISAAWAHASHFNHHHFWSHAEKLLLHVRLILYDLQPRILDFGFSGITLFRFNSVSSNNHPAFLALLIRAHLVRDQNIEAEKVVTDYMQGLDPDPAVLLELVQLGIL